MALDLTAQPLSEPYAHTFADTNALLVNLPADATLIQLRFLTTAGKQSTAGTDGGSVDAGALPVTADATAEFALGGTGRGAHRNLNGPSIYLSGSASAVVYITPV